MSKQEERSEKVAQWLEHLRSWKQSGKPMCTYAAGHGLTASAMYHWRRVLIREGHWQDRAASARCPRAAGDGSTPPLRFARVAVTDAVAAAPVIVRIVLGNGRHAQIELPRFEHLNEVLGILERRV